MKRTKKEKGITLIALIITIVVLLILAVVAINAVTGDGIIQHATDAKTEYGVAQEVEEIQLALNEWSILRNMPDNEKTLAEFLSEKSSELNITVEEYEKDAKITTKSGAKYKATEQGKLIKIIKLYVDYVDYSSGETTDSFEFYAEEGMTWEQFIESSYNYLLVENREYFFEIHSETVSFADREKNSASWSSGTIEGIKKDEEIKNNQRLVLEFL